jgi:cytochrome c556
MIFRRFVLGLAATGTLATAGIAAADPIENRQLLMRAGSSAAKVSGEMIKGNIPFNKDVANLALNTFVAVSTSFVDFFPEGSETGGDTRATETIWSDWDGFVAADAEYAEASAAAIAAEPADLDAFKAVFAPIAETCNSCHEDYRVSRN